MNVTTRKPVKRQTKAETIAAKLDGFAVQMPLIRQDENAVAKCMIDAASIIRQLTRQLGAQEKAIIQDRADARRYRWLRSRKSLTLETMRTQGPWSRDGIPFTPTHYLCSDGTQFSAHEGLDSTIDEAAKIQP